MIIFSHIRVSAIGISAIAVGCVLFFAVSTTALAQESGYNLLSNIGGIESFSAEGESFTGLINVAYKLAIGLGAALAVLVIIYAALRYMTTDAFSQKTQLKEQLAGAVGGLLMMIAAVALLNIINPQITLLEISTFKEVPSSSGGVYSGYSGTTFVAAEESEDGGEAGDGGGDGWLDYALVNPVLDERLHDLTDRTAENDPPGTVYDQPADGGWIGDAQNSAGQVSFKSKAECEGVKNDGEACVRDTDVTLPTTSPPSVSKDILVMYPSDDNYDKILKSAHAAKIGWPANPYRRPVDFASKGDKTIRISRTAVEMDKYFQDQFKAKFGIILKLVSAYRDEAYNHCLTHDRAGNCNKTSKNHQLGYALDYSTKDLTVPQLHFLQDLIIKTNVVRVGWGKTNAAGTHVQWDDGRNAKWVYWCYQEGYGPHKGKNTMPKKWRKTGNCGW